MQNLLKNKLFIILFAFILLTFALCTNCFASYDFEYEGETYTVGDNLTNTFKYWFIAYKDFGTGGGLNFFFFGADNPIYFKDNSGNTDYQGFYSLTETGERVGLYSGRFYPNNYFVSDKLKYDDLSTCTKDDLSEVSSTGSSTAYSNLNIIYSTHDLMHENGSLVFQGAPQVEVPKVELMKAIQVEELPIQVVAIVKIILPVCLIVFGTLLVVYLIKSKNLLHL